MGRTGAGSWGGTNMPRRVLRALNFPADAQIKPTKSQGQPLNFAWVRTSTTHCRNHAQQRWLGSSRCPVLFPSGHHSSRGAGPTPACPVTLRELPGWEAQRQAEVISAAALEMRLKPRGLQGHIPNMSWLNKAIYQHHVDTAELGTESQRALAMGPCNTQRAWGALGRVEKCPLRLPFRKKAAGTAVPTAGRPNGHHPGEGLLWEMLPVHHSPAGITPPGSQQPRQHPEVPRCPTAEPPPGGGSGGGSGRERAQPSWDLPGPGHPLPRGSAPPGRAPSTGAALGAAAPDPRGSSRDPGDARPRPESASRRRGVRHPPDEAPPAPSPLSPYLSGLGSRRLPGASRC